MQVCHNFLCANVAETPANETGDGRQGPGRLLAKRVG